MARPRLASNACSSDLLTPRSARCDALLVEEVGSFQAYARYDRRRFGETSIGPLLDIPAPQAVFRRSSIDQ
jgi:hypothetical protein